MTREVDGKGCVKDAKEKVDRCSGIGCWFGDGIVAGLAGEGGAEAS